ncbi:hypothetical protein FH972_002150 [Carpinus fangiana]|uniref:Uncharacterized protein n=1 Tax=Carpinus fangiana TaxID=176857 RepID=A0A5N6QGC7_9ROSI|nr:hypothetical protein FH972_002150 [Carpinus fangiana]
MLQERADSSPELRLVIPTFSTATGIIYYTFTSLAGICIITTFLLFWLLLARCRYICSTTSRSSSVLYYHTHFGSKYCLGTTVLDFSDKSWHGIGTIRTSRFGL